MEDRRGVGYYAVCGIAMEGRNPAALPVPDRGTVGSQAAGGPGAAAEGARMILPPRAVMVARLAAAVAIPAAAFL